MSSNPLRMPFYNPKDAHQFVNSGSIFGSSIKRPSSASSRSSDKSYRSAQSSTSSNSAVSSGKRPADRFTIPPKPSPETRPVETTAPVSEFIPLPPKIVIQPPSLPTTTTPPRNMSLSPQRPHITVDEALKVLDRAGYDVTMTRKRPLTPIFACNICGKSYSSKAGLDAHKWEDNAHCLEHGQCFSETEWKEHIKNYPHKKCPRGRCGNRPPFKDKNAFFAHYVKDHM